MDVISNSMDILKHFVDSLKELDGIVDVSEDYDIINFTSNPMADAVVGSYVNIKIDVLNGSMCDSMMIEFINQIKKLTVTENGQYIFTKDEGYNALERVEVEVNIDVDDYYNKGYTEGYSIGVATSYDVGKEDGINEQKSKLAPISITENGTYTNEDGYNEIHVEVPDLNGDYNEGYANGTQDGYNNGYATGEEIGYNNGVAVGREDGLNEGYRNGYDDGISDGTANAGEIIAETAQVLNVTENGIYATQYTKDDDYTKPDLITGYFNDGRAFYDYADVNNGHFNTKVSPTANSRIEFWWKPAATSNGYHYQNIFGAGLSDNNGPDNFEIHYFSSSRTELRLKIGNEMARFTIDNAIWNHILIENGSLYINDELKAQVNTSTYVSDGTPLIINSTPSRYTYNGNGLFGMFKIDNHIFIPSDGGFINYETGEHLTGYLPSNSAESFAGNYTYIKTYNEPVKEGNLIRTINVDIKPKIDVIKDGIKFSRSTFDTIPDYFVFKDGNYAHMFEYCTNLMSPPEDYVKTTSMERCFYSTAIKQLPKWDFSNCKAFNDCFSYCRSLTDLSAIVDWNYPHTGVRWLCAFYGCGNVTDCPAIYADSIHNGNDAMTSSWNFMFASTKLTNFGGWIGLKYSITAGLNDLSNLTYQSCINILNGLYDFIGNNEVPNSNQGQLKVSQNFLDLVGDEISIAIAKGWSLTTN